MADAANNHCMTNLVTELTVSHPQMERLCLAHCNIHDRGMLILS